MELASARDLKAILTQTVLAPFTTGGTVKSFNMPAGPLEAAARPQPSIALGIAQRTATDYRLAVRLQRRELETSSELDTIRKRAKNEVDVRFIGRVEKNAEKPWAQRRHRPLRLGTSIGHFNITAGTLGAVVLQRSDQAVLPLSNNHVLADENRGKVGDAILQPGVSDDGKNPEDLVATLAGMVRLKKSGINLVDAAVAAPVEGIEVDRRAIRGLGNLAGIGSEFVDEGTEVAKLGRSTELTRGKVTAFELDNLMVEYGIGVLRFDGQIEVEGSGDKPFSRGGDSGSLVVDADRRAVGLLFAGGDIGGANGQGLTYVHPIRAVLDALKVNLAF